MRVFLLQKIRNKLHLKIMFPIFQHTHFNVANTLLKRVGETQTLIRNMLGVYFIRNITAVDIY